MSEFEPKVHFDGKDKLVVESGGELEIKSGGAVSAAGTQASHISDVTGTASALTENAGAIGGTNDGDLPDLSSPDAAGNAAAVREVADMLNAVRVDTAANTTAINAILAVLEGAGLTATS